MRETRTIQKIIERGLKTTPNDTDDFKPTDYERVAIRSRALNHPEYARARQEAINLVIDLAALTGAVVRGAHRTVVEKPGKTQRMLGAKAARHGRILMERVPGKYVVDTMPLVPDDPNKRSIKK